MRPEQLADELTTINESIAQTLDRAGDHQFRLEAVWAQLNTLIIQIKRDLAEAGR